MTQEDLIRITREAGFFVKDSEAYSPSVQYDHELTPYLERFAALVAAAEQKKWEDQTAIDIHEAVRDEREACAKVCEKQIKSFLSSQYKTRQPLSSFFERHAAASCAEAIRAR